MTAGARDGRAPATSAMATGLPRVIGSKRKLPLGTRERPYLNLTNPGQRPGGGRAIPVQNVNLTRSPADDTDPVWSPDGTKILFASNGEDTNGDMRIDKVRDDGTYHIWIMNPDGSGQKQLTHDPGNQVEPPGLPTACASPTPPMKKATTRSTSSLSRPGRRPSYPSDRARSDIPHGLPVAIRLPSRATARACRRFIA